MTIHVNQYNDNFASFADFAEKSVAAGNRKAVANLGEPLAGRGLSLVASKTDAAYSALSRSTEDKDINDRTRTLFRAAVADLFGGEEHIPPAVRDNMKIGDYGKGRPLTARRIIAVKTAIDAEFAKRAFEEALGKYGRELEPAEADFARRLFSAHSAGMPAKNAGMFARYLFALDLSCLDESRGEVAAKAGRMAKEIASWRDFDFADPALEAPRGVFEKEATNYIAGKLSGGEFCKAPGMENISLPLYADINRADITINGAHVDPAIGKDAIVALFQKAIPGAKAQRLVSWALNQSLATPFTYAANGGKLEMHDGTEPVDLRELPGGKALAGRNGDEHQSGLAAAKDVSYRLDVSEDGKTATLVNTMDSLLMVGDRVETSATGFGSAKQSIKVTFDLSDPDAPTISRVDIAQTLGVEDPA